jgi:acyl-coenzyme A synthetase/AMP-(fatty) acid ligase/thioesterase domain-containing protein/acyl carrier protein
LVRLNIAAVILPPGDSSARIAAEAHDVTLFIMSTSRDCDIRLDLVQSGTCVQSGDNEPSDIAYILPTSGTTGRQKFVPISHCNQIDLSNRIKKCFELGSQDRCLCLSPVFYSHGLSMGLFTPLLSGGSVALPGLLTNPTLPDWLADLAPTWCSGGPAIYRAISERSAQSAFWPTERLRFLVSAGMALPEDVRIAIETAVGVPVLEHYGLTESGMMVTNQLQQHLRKPSTCGIAPADTVAIAGPDGELLPPGDIGEILVRGPTVTSGYLDDPAANAKLFVGDWLRTGDLGCLDDDRFLTIRGRTREVINSGGEKIMPSEIETQLTGHPAIAEAAAFGLPHPRSGEQVAAAVVVRQGRSATAKELREWLTTRLAQYKLPRRILFVESLPRALTGKVQRLKLAELARKASFRNQHTDRLPQDYAMTEGELAQLWAELLGRDGQIGLDDDFFEIGGDSFLAVRMLLEVERLAGMSLPDDFLYKASTIREFAKQLGTLAGSKQNPLITVQDGGEQPPIFFCHGNYLGGGYYTRRFARLLGPDQPFYTLPPPPLRDDEPMPSMEQSAAERVPLLLEKQPTGQFRVGGFCNGALLAFEMARQLLNAGRKVELVIMIDPPSFNVRPHFRLSCSAFAAAMRLAGLQPPRSEQLLTAFSAQIGSLSGRAERFVRTTRTGRAAKIKRLVVAACRKFWPDRSQSSDVTAGPGHPLGAPSNGSAQCDAAKALHRRHHRLVSSYTPSPVRAPALIFSAVHSGYPWRPFCDDIHVVNLPPDHFGWIRTDLEFIAQSVRAQLRNPTVPGDLIGDTLAAKAASAASL